MSYHKYQDQNKGSKKRVEKITLGTSEDGLVLHITRAGLEINGYYTRRAGEAPDALLREPLCVTWENVDKMRTEVNRTKATKSRAQEKELIGKDSPISDEELEKLPKVTLNGKLFYVDIVNKIIRPIDKPHIAYDMQK